MKLRRLVILAVVLGILPFSVKAGFEVLGSLVYKHTALPGETYTTEIQVHNTGDSEQEIRIYQRDYLFNHEGASFYDEPVSHGRSNSQWMEYSPKTMILRGNDTQSIQFEVTVPESDSIRGTFWSILMVEGVSQIDPNAQGQLNISTTIRYAVQVVTNIGQTGLGELEFMEPVLVEEGTKKYLDVVLVNTGERLISPDVSMELFDLNSGESVKVIEAAKNGLYPTTSSKFRFPLEGIKTKMTYQALIVADGSGEDVFGLEYSLEL